MLEIKNILNAERAHDSPPVIRLKADVARLKKDVKAQNDKISALKRDIAFYVTHLDLAAEDIRVYTCGHDDLRNILNDQNATREKNAAIVATEFFRDWEDDADFLVKYNAARQCVLDHHRAHERMKQGRGDGSGYIKGELIGVDHRRGVVITYH